MLGGDTLYLHLHTSKATATSHSQTLSVRLTEQILRNISGLGANLPCVCRTLLIIAVSINGRGVCLTISINGCLILEGDQ